MNQNEPTTRNITVLNRASVKKYALAVSICRRAGKFTRVGEGFYERCEARLEAAIRALDPQPGELIPGDYVFLTKTSREKADEKLEALAQRIVYSEVAKHPSLGCTLK